MEKVYISGPITGYADYNKPAFMECARLLSIAGFLPVNPAYNGVPDDAPWETHLRADIPMLLGCSGICMLKGWDGSRGAKIELLIAQAFHMELMWLDGCVLKQLHVTEPKFKIIAQSSLGFTQDDDNPKDETICQEADRIVSTTRQGQYGHPQEDFTRTANLLSASGYRRWSPDGKNNELKHLDAKDVGMIMIMVKLSRLIHQTKRDTLVDLAGYAKCISMLDECPTLSKNMAPAGAP